MHVRVDLRADRAELAVAYSSSATAASGSSIGTQAQKPAKRSGWDRTSSAMASLPIRAICREISGEPRSSTGGAQMLMSWR